MGRREQYLNELMPQEDELAAQRRAASEGGTDQAWGQGIGGAAGTILGGLAGTFLAPGLGTAAGAGIGGSLGAGLGGLIGGGIGNSAAQQDQQFLDAKALDRQKKLAEYQMRQQALDSLMSQA